MRHLVAVMFALAARPAAASIDLTLVTGGVPYLVDIQHAGDSRLFLVSQEGRILIWTGTQVLSTPFLDIRALVTFSGEQGLLGLSFHPGYATNGLFYVHYTDTSGNTAIARYQVSSNANVSDPASAAVILTQAQPFSNHKGGQIRFGPDGYLYIALGDGGSGGDPEDNGQSLGTLLGKILRIDVNGGPPYGIPATNPFVDTAGARGEIWSYGLRNPWRFSFDRATGDMFIADVGQSEWEEIDFEPARTGGRNYGWRLMEGSHCFSPPASCNDGSLTLPVLEYSHAFGCSVTGGFRYRGSATSSYAGAFFYGDFCSGRIWSARQAGSAWQAIQELDTALSIATFGEDSAGELYVAHYAAGGQLYRLVIPHDRGFTDDPLLSGSSAIKAVHVVELRTRIDGVRSMRGLGAYAWSDPAPAAGGAVRALHVMELRTALNQAYAAAMQTPPPYTDPSVGAGTLIQAAHVMELRAAVAALE